MSDTLRWGIMGVGNIARQFAENMVGATRGRVTACGSRSGDKADAFAREFKIAGAYGGYDELLADREVDAIYVALPNSMHLEWTLKAIDAGKHVLCEKPISVNTEQAERMFDAAERAGLVLVEAFMYRSHPLTHAVLDAVRGGAIGRVTLIRSSFCYAVKQWQGNSRFSVELAGGGAMDVGCYCINLSRLIAGAEPTAISAFGHLHGCGVDDLVVASLSFPNDVLATFTCGMQTQTTNAAIISGTEGYIEIPVPWKPPVTGAEYTVCRMTPPRSDAGSKGPPPNPRQTITVDAPAPLYAMEAGDFATTVLDGAPPRITRADTLGNMRVLDEVRQQIGLPF